MTPRFLPRTLLALAVLTTGIHGSDLSLTLYNQGFAVVRESLPLDLKEGVNDVAFSNATAQVEPSSVILRDPAGKVALQILEQNYRNDPLSEGLLLSLNEGKVIEFEQRHSGGETRLVRGRIVRSGYPPSPPPHRHPSFVPSNAPIIEVEGKLRFNLPGTPVFPDLGDQTILKPTLNWKIAVAQPAQLKAELAYVTGGLSWEADYNVVAPEKGDLVDVSGWITMQNQSGRVFENASFKLMAGDVSKIQPDHRLRKEKLMASMARLGSAAEPAVTEKSFDEYHLYSLSHQTTLANHETKQVEFIRATGITAERYYLYDGLKRDDNLWRLPMENRRGNQGLGHEQNTTVAVMLEIKNTKENQLGLPLPKGRVRFYRKDSDGSLEFTGENTIEHTPQGETVSFYTGNAFDLVGGRQRTNFQRRDSEGRIEESFIITVRNRKKEPVEIRIIEHLFRWLEWEIIEQSDPFIKTNAQQMELRVALAPDEEKKVTYTVRYTW